MQFEGPSELALSSKRGKKSEYSVTHPSNKASNQQAFNKEP